MTRIHVPRARVLQHVHDFACHMMRQLGDSGLREMVLSKWAYDIMSHELVESTRAVTDSRGEWDNGYILLHIGNNSVLVRKAYP